MKKSQLHVLRSLCVALLCLVGLVYAQAPAPTKITDLKPTVILVSIDGARWDFPDKYPAPVLRELIRTGVRAEMIPSFPSKTFPNHYTLVTGLYPGNHGIVANNFWDDQLQAKFKAEGDPSALEGKWWGGEPIWVTVEKQGQKAAAMFWPGSEAPIQGMRPTYYQKYQHEMPHEQRVAWLLEQFDRPVAERPTFATLYFSDVDTANHDHGPDSPQAPAALAKVDKSIGDLIAGLKARGIYDQVNLIVAADHGHTPISNQRQMFLEDYVDVNSVFVADWSPVMALRAKDGNNEALYAKLKQGMHHATVYRKGDLPKRWHYGAGPRIMPIIAVADPGWGFYATRKRMLERKAGEEKGAHGYDPAVRDMHAIFIAHGPAFRQGVTLPPFENVNVYPAMAKILGVTPAKNDGDAKVIAKGMVTMSRVMQMWSRPCNQESVEANLLLEVKARVSGMIVDQSGAPFIGKQLNIRDFPSNKTIAENSTNERGEFEFKEIPSGKYRLVLTEHREFKQPGPNTCTRDDCKLGRIILLVNPTHQPFALCPAR